ncbi:MAG: hypothetical protein AAGJ18_28030 [Bacteroidota bacterium]
MNRYTAFLFILLFLIFLSCESTPETTAKAIVSPVASDASTLKTATEPPIAIDTSISLSYIMGQFEPTEHPQFVQVPPKYANGRKDRWLRKETFTAFLEMYEAAKKEGIELKI